MVTRSVSEVGADARLNNSSPLAAVGISISSPPGNLGPATHVVRYASRPSSSGIACSKVRKRRRVVAVKIAVLAASMLAARQFENKS